jgi:hypothetical protein
VTITLNDGSELSLNDGSLLTLNTDGNIVATTVTIALVGYCASQGHVTVDVSVQGVAGSKQLIYEVGELRDDLDWGDAQRIVRDLLRLHFRGLTLNQAKNELQAGIMVTI